MRAFIFSTAIAITVALTLGFSTLAHALCPSYHPPVAYIQVLSVNPDGSLNLTMYNYDWDSSVPPMALKNSSGKVLAYSQTGFINIRMPKNAGWWHLDLMDKTVCGENAGWVAGPAIKN